MSVLCCLGDFSLGEWGGGERSGWQATSSEQLVFRVDQAGLEPSSLDTNSSGLPST